VLINLN